MGYEYDGHDCNWNIRYNSLCVYWIVLFMLAGTIMLALFMASTKRQ